MKSDRVLTPVSIDLDNLWAYLRTRGDPGWISFPDFLDVAIPRALDFFSELNVTATFCVVGRDAECAALQNLMGEITAAGHEIGNHSYDHRIDIHRWSKSEIRDDFDRSEAAIGAATGATPVGFRGPSFRISDEVRRELIRRDYRYDSSIFPTVVGPLARAVHFSASTLSADQKTQQKDLFGKFSDGFQPLRPHQWPSLEGTLLEIPVTTFPFLRLPVHMTYIHFIADQSETLAAHYFRLAVRTCSTRNIPFSFLLHASDFIGRNDIMCPRFLPGMKRVHEEKLKRMRATIQTLGEYFDLCSAGVFADSISVS